MDQRALAGSRNGVLLPVPALRRGAWSWFALPMLLLALLLPAEPAAALVGDPPVTVLTPNIEAYPQNSDIAQDDASVIYVANGSGVLSFDGERWQMIPLPNGDLARSLAHDGNSRTYLGGYNLLGYLERDSAGQSTFHDLTPLFAPQLGGEKFADIWQVLVSPQGVFFVATQHLFLYQPRTGTIRLWRFDGRFGAAVQRDGEILLQFRGEGLRRFQDGDWQPMPGTEAMRDLLFSLVPLPDGGLLGVSADGRWREYIDGGVRERAMPAGFPASSELNAACVLKDGTIAFAAIDGTLWLLDPRSNRARGIHITRGALNELRLAADGGLFAISDLAVFHIDWPGDWTSIDPSHGINGAVHRIRRWPAAGEGADGGRWLALADNGVYAAAADTSGGTASFQRLHWTDNDAWDLLPLDPHRALLAELYRLKLIDDQGVHTLGDRDLYPHLLLRSRFDAGVIYVGTDYGLAVVEQKGRSWQLRIDRGSNEMRVGSIIELGPAELLIGTERDGVRRILLTPDHARIAEDRRLVDADGVRYGKVARAVLSTLPDGGIIASTGAGLFRWTDRHFAPLTLAGIDTGAAPRPVLTFDTAPNGDQWAFGEDRIYRRPALKSAIADGGVAQPSWYREEIGTIASGFVESIAFDGDSAVLFGCANAVLRHESMSGDAAAPLQRVLLRSVERIGPDDRNERLALQPPTPARLKQGDFSLAFRFAVPDFHGLHSARYQARLQGHDDEYSDWRPSTQYIYRHLDPGEYVFEARARDSFGRTSEIAPFRFVILPSWYATRWAQALWAVLLLGGISALTFGGAVWRTRRLNAAKIRLERMVAERTSDLESANRRLNDMAHVDGLTAVANRRRLDDWLLKAWQNCGEYSRPLAVMIVDIDEFKPYNDRMGHLAGDDLLKRVVEILSQCLRRTEDLVARYGGDEFVAVLPGADLKNACMVAETMRRRIELSGLGATISIGVAARQPQSGEAVAVLLREADDALYQSKQGGRNRVSSYTPADSTDTA